MARTSLPATALTFNGGVNNPSTTAIDQANGMVLSLASTAIPAANLADHVVLVVSNTAGGAKNCIVRAGTGDESAAGQYHGAAFRASLGDLTVSVGASQTAYIGPFEAARFVQDSAAGGGTSGAINIDFASGTTGTILAIVLPRGL